MKTVPVDQAAKSLDALIVTVAETNGPVLITGGAGAAVLVSEAEWRSIQETLCLAAVPGMCESVAEGMATPICDCDEGLDW